MYEKDFIVRLIQHFFEGIARITNKIENGDIEDAKIDIEKTYELLGESSSFFRESTFEGILSFLNQKNSIQLKKIDLLAELILNDAKIQRSENIKCSMFKKAKMLWEYYNRQAKEYSFEREEHLFFIKEYLKNDHKNN